MAYVPVSSYNNPLVKQWEYMRLCVVVMSVSNTIACLAFHNKSCDEQEDMQVAHSFIIILTMGT